MAFYQITLLGSANAQQVNNVFHYITTSILASNEEAFNLNNEFITEVLPSIRGVIHSSYSANQLYTIAPQAPDVFAGWAFTPGSANGLRLGEALPIYNAWGFETVRQRRDIRNGYKRFGPVSEGDQSGGGPIAGFLTNLTALRNAMNLNLEVEYGGGGSTATMIIVKRIKYNPDPLEPDKWSYRVPIAGDPLVYYEANQWVYDKMTTQNTRKLGRGA